MFKIGSTIDFYKIISQVGQGSYGTVYEVENTISFQRYALKVVILQGEAPQRELNAIRRYRNLQHRNLIQIHHVGQKENYLYYTMDWANGCFAQQNLSPAELKSNILQLLDGIELLHENSLIHRDIKPENILWENGHAILGDIGLLSHKDSASFAGTPGFISPKVWQGKGLPNEHSDLYALAKVIYCMISNCNVGDYPNYRGSRDEISSQLFNAVLTVCAEGSSINKVDDFRKLLQKTPPPPPTQNKTHTYIINA